MKSKAASNRGLLCFGKHKRAFGPGIPDVQRSDPSLC
jgi:hypothetical protein